MNTWTHPQGLAALIAGIYAGLSPIWTTHPDGKAMYTMITLGVLTALLAGAADVQVTRTQQHRAHT
jgi:hypothetical protein